MSAILLGARLLLSAVFVVAGITKLADSPGSRQALRDFGVPRPFTGPVAILLPVAELGIAAALIPVPLAWWGAIGALVLLILFIVGISVNLARGRRPDCHCFGHIASSPVGWTTLIRNVGLACLAGLVIAQGGTDPGWSAVGWLTGLTLVQYAGLLIAVLVVALLAVESWFLLQLFSQQGRFLLRLDAIETRLASGSGAHDPAGRHPAANQGLPIGVPAPSFRLSGIHREVLTLEALRAVGKPVLLLFSDPDCGPCTELLPEFGRWQREHSAAVTFALISRGAIEANQRKCVEHGILTALIQDDREVALAYKAPGTPMAVVVAADGTIGSPLAAGSDAIRALLATAVGARGTLPAPEQLRQALPATNGRCENCGRGVPPPSLPPAGLEVGETAPAFALPDLSGTTVDSITIRGRNTLLLFWNPSCSFCQRMLPDLRAWEADPPRGAPDLLVISSGDIDANRALGLRSPVLLDQGFQAGSAYGASGTPSAVLIDRAGRIASKVTIGAPDVLSLARRE